VKRRNVQRIKGKAKENSQKKERKLNNRRGMKGHVL